MQLSKHWQQAKVKIKESGILDQFYSGGRLSISEASLLFFVLFNVLNYFHLYSVQCTLPVVDVVSYLSQENGSGNMQQIMEDAYMRKREFYFDNYQTSTIVITPQVQISRTELKVLLNEGYYNFTESRLIKGPDDVSTTFSNDLHFGIGNFEDKRIPQFVSSILQPIVPAPVLDRFSAFNKLFFLIPLSNFLVFLCSLVLFVMSLFSGGVCRPQKTRTRVFLSIFFVCFVALLSFQILNVVVQVILNSHVNNGKFVANAVISLGQIFISVVLSYWYFFYGLQLLTGEESKDEVDKYLNPYMKDSEEDESGLIHLPVVATKFQESLSDTSSVYSSDQRGDTLNYDSSKVGGTTKVPYSGPVDIPKSANSVKRSSGNPFSRSFTAPLPLGSPTSDSSGFEYIKASLSNPATKPGSISYSDITSGEPNLPLRMPLSSRPKTPSPKSPQDSTSVHSPRQNSAEKSLSKPFDPKSLEQIIEDSRKEADSLNHDHSVKNVSSPETDDTDKAKEDLQLRRVSANHD